MALRVIELYCGIGGCASALAPALGAGVAEVVAAVDINPNALAVYRHNFPHGNSHAMAVESLSVAELEALEADLWWLSPPCQPFTRRGKGRDADDPRAVSFLKLLEQLAVVRPSWVALENVPGFAGSRVHRQLLDTLGRAGYGTIVERQLCPSELGWPNRRRRYYLVASRCRLVTPPRTVRQPLQLAQIVTSDDPEDEPELWLDPALLRRYHGALDLVRRDDPAALTSCFTSAYGRSPVRSGSYLLSGGQGVARARRFSPREILRLLGFPTDFWLPVELGYRQAWPLVGNSLSLPAVRTILSLVPALAEPLTEVPT